MTVYYTYASILLSVDAIIFRRVVFYRISSVKLTRDSSRFRDSDVRILQLVINTDKCVLYCYSEQQS